MESERTLPRLMLTIAVRMTRSGDMLGWNCQGVAGVGRVVFGSTRGLPADVGTHASDWSRGRHVEKRRWKCWWDDEQLS